MLSLVQKPIFIIFLLLLTGCMSKNNGKYHTQYSYHPYYDLYAKKMSGTAPIKKIKSTKSKQKQAKSSLSNKSRYPTE
ncbi:MAG: Unknown protein [uncultured Sulfurovum sp.]|uniref:Lipoprotein n=1 Tax=uncultured Sulfurovum sp. TaxID=269237 RepID=A0A6S6UEP2_9BACT|nr:MAG: Unknown protein [uncultured Sulfurovum sp.]